jgi:Flp pilus assembly protein CpaB
MFQPPDRAAERRPLLLGGAAVAVVLVVVLVVALARGGGGGGAGPSAGATPSPQILTGGFTKTTMTCPHEHEIGGDTCLIPLDLQAGRVIVTVTWTGDAIVAMGISDKNGKDLGPQITGEKGKAVFDSTKIGAPVRGPSVSASGTVPAGTYRLRVVDVTHPAAPFSFTVTVVNP